jgi:hypothetical protein
VIGVLLRSKVESRKFSADFLGCLLPSPGTLRGILEPMLRLADVFIRILFLLIHLTTEGGNQPAH